MNHLVCGSFGSQSEDDIEELLSPCSTLRRTIKKNRDRDRDSKNPYANRGLDKFYALLAELEGKKQRIYTQKGSRDISLVRFVYSTSDDWKPVVVKLKKDRKKQEKKSTTRHNSINNAPVVSASNNSGQLVMDKFTIDSSNSVMSSSSSSSSVSGNEEIGPTKKKPRNEINNIWSDSLGYWRKLRLRLGVGDLSSPCVYLPLMIILVLLLLTVYGKAFAVVCTSVGWYLLPMITPTKDRGVSSKVPMKINHIKKEYGQRFSDKSIIGDKDRDGSSSPKSVLDNKYSHQQNW